MQDIFETAQFQETSSACGATGKSPVRSLEYVPKWNKFELYKNQLNLFNLKARVPNWNIKHFIIERSIIFNKINRLLQTSPEQGHDFVPK
jgi:hypothetical protein